MPKIVYRIYTIESILKLIKNSISKKQRKRPKRNDIKNNIDFQINEEKVFIVI